MSEQQHKTVQQALVEVMKSVGAVRKDGRNKHQGFNFRGIDAVVNAVSPALQKAGVIVTPKLEKLERHTMQTAKGATMNSVDVIVQYVFTGPAGDSISATVPGEAFDSGDKATAKAMSVAFRTALLQALALPTDEIDPDEESPHATMYGRPMTAREQQGQMQQQQQQSPRQYAQQQHPQYAPQQQQQMPPQQQYQQQYAQQQAPPQQMDAAQQQLQVQQQQAQQTPPQQQQQQPQQGMNWATEYERAKNDPQQLAALRKWAAKVDAPREVLVQIRTREQQLAQQAQQ